MNYEFLSKYKEIYTKLIEREYRLYKPNKFLKWLLRYNDNIFQSGNTLRISKFELYKILLIVQKQAAYNQWIFEFDCKFITSMYHPNRYIEQLANIKNSNSFTTMTNHLNHHSISFLQSLDFDFFDNTIITKERLNIAFEIAEWCGHKEHFDIRSAYSLDARIWFLDKINKIRLKL